MKFCSYMYIIHYCINLLTVDAFGPSQHQPCVKIQCKHNTGIVSYIPCITLGLCKISLLLTTVVSRVVKSSRLPLKITPYLVSIGRLLCLKFLYGWRFLNKISLDWPLSFLFFRLHWPKVGCHIYSFTLGNELLRLGTKE